MATVILASVPYSNINTILDMHMTSPDQPKRPASTFGIMGTGGAATMRKSKQAQYSEL